MKKVDRLREANGDLMIRVYKCDNFDRAVNDAPIYMNKKIKDGTLHNSKNVRFLLFCDRINTREE